MKNVRKLSIIFGIITTAVFFIGFFLFASENRNGIYLLYAGFILGAIYWIWSIIQVTSTDDLKKYQKTFWLIIVVAVPFFGAFLYNIIHQSRNRIAT
ncbi:MAG TPA: PLDc N-terminal domain-containing protein [Flavitalea sp.]|nr:PLDc N-terminal domain-containing protein [Flavitalea sp.]